MYFRPLHPILASINLSSPSSPVDIDQVKNLRGTLQEAEEAQIQQKKVYDDVVNERDVLGSQLIRRNDELALLYEKIKIQQSTLNKGELQVCVIAS
jgi:hypothetical protein